MEDVLKCSYQKYVNVVFDCSVHIIYTWNYLSGTSNSLICLLQTAFPTTIDKKTFYTQCKFLSPSHIVLA